MTHDVHFIAVNDGVDSNQEDNEFTPFRNIINDSYSRDISVKIRSHLEVKKRKGQFVGAFAAYGYLKSPDDKNQLVVDDYAAEVVRDIFRWKLEGMSQQGIADWLNADGVLSPSEYKRSLGMKYISGFKSNPQAKWSAVTVGRILKNPLYNLILVKDLSRLGRDFVEVGRYTDVVFPALGCRFVSVLDCLDSEGDNTDMLHFRSLMNDYHLKDLSSKIKSVLYAKKKSGQYLTAYAPYGYRKSADDKHRLEIDEEAAAVVRRIFQMRYSGMAYGKIAAALNRDGILPPRWHWEMRCGKGHCKYSKLPPFAGAGP